VRILVIGAGAAGVAAAAHASSGSQVTVIHGRAGATALNPGACDQKEWGTASNVPLSVDGARVLQELGCWKISDTAALIVSGAGQVRWARAADTALLDLSELAGRRIAVTDLGRWGYDAGAWVATLNASRWAKQTGTRFDAVLECVPAPHAVRVNDYDFAALHDDEGQARSLGDALAAANKGFQAWLLPPSLGIQQPVREKLEQRLGVKVGEGMGETAGPAGARFELARDALFKRQGIACLQGLVTRLVRAPDAEVWQATWHDQGGKEHQSQAERVILACGGIVSGGLQLGQARLDEAIGSAFELSVGLQAPMAFGHIRPNQAASWYGVDFTQAGLAVLERVGVIANDTQIPGLLGLFAAGDVIANGSRSVLGALEAGCQAARSAAVA